MPRYTIPAHPGRFSFGQHYSGKHYLVTNDKSGKNEVIIPVRTKSEAEELCRRLNAGEHDGVVSSPDIKG
jgi:hypothetical protein